MRKCVECGHKAEQWHHVVPRCEGGILIVPICRKCHVALHSAAGDFARWGRMGGLVTASNPENWKRNLRQFRKEVGAESPASEQPFAGSNPGANSEPRSPGVRADALISVSKNPYTRVRAPALGAYARP